MALPILYSFRRCPYAIRGRLALAKAGIQWEHREVSLKNKPDAMLAVSSKGTVPVLVLSDDTIIDESRDVVLWAMEQNDPDGWLDVDRTILLELINANDHEFKAHLDRYKYHVRHPEHDQAYYRAQGEHFLQRLQDMLKAHDGIGLMARRVTLGDVTIFPFIRQFAGVDRAWFDNSPYPDLVRWLLCWEKRDEFKSVMQKYDFWQPGDRPLRSA